MPEALQGLVYQVEDGELVVLVLAVDKREDMAAYKSAVLRLLGTTH
jgi:mRNA interferase RelE/StbE